MVNEKGSLIQVSPDHEQVSTQSQSTDIWDWIMKVAIPEGVEWVIENKTYFQAKLYDGAGTEVAGTTKIALGFKAPGDERPQLITPAMSYRPFYNLSPNNQRDSDYKSQDLSFHFKKDEISFVEDTPLYVLAKGPTGIDLTDTSGTYDSYMDFPMYEYEL